MARIAGVDIPDKKQVEIALTYIYGIGRSSSKKILDKIRIDSQKKASDLTKDEISKIKEVIEKDYKIEGDLRREKSVNIKRLKEINSWRGIRHKKGLPVRGQKTRTNTRTVRGNVRRTMGSGRRAAPTAK